MSTTASHESFEPEILRKMTIPPLEMPDTTMFKPHLGENELENLANRDKQVLLHISVLEQKINWMMQCLVEGNAHMRNLQAQSIRTSDKLDKMEDERKALSMKTTVFRWAGSILAAGGIAAIGKKMIDRLFP